MVRDDFLAGEALALAGGGLGGIEGNHGIGSQSLAHKFGKVRDYWPNWDLIRSMISLTFQVRPSVLLMPWIFASQ